MPRHTRKAHAPRPSRLPVDLIHWRDPDNNERSICNAEERATYIGETVRCTVVLAEVTCKNCQSTADFSLATQKALQPTHFTDWLLKPTQKPTHYVVIGFYTAEDAARFITQHNTGMSGKTINPTRLLTAKEMESVVLR